MFTLNKNKAELICAQFTKGDNYSIVNICKFSKCELSLHYQACHCKTKKLIKKKKSKEKVTESILKKKFSLVMLLSDSLTLTGKIDSIDGMYAPKFSF